MAISMRDELRALSDEELELVLKSHIPLILELSDAELASVIKLTRERRRRARNIANRQRREMRGKASPAGSRPASGDRGTRLKGEVLAGAMKRLNRERQRRLDLASVPEQVRLARKALQLKRAAGKGHGGPSYRTASKGMRNIANTKSPRLVHPMEVGRVSQFVRDAQARRDSR